MKVHAAVFVKNRSRGIATTVGFTPIIAKQNSLDFSYIFLCESITIATIMKVNSRPIAFAFFGNVVHIIQIDYSP